ncbi:hypothetical protein [Rivihabitans pingtungensis]|uniref:Uncharacterized protein n=1 Tax=Rivihabitans pingtungensis TaxID=1054498 RepID=A0A318KHP8_9NEIS|nr:hypothetical protein [Rivihabitans pingtungensis]PXX74698.1 hypothetical protein DFR34_12934 [Rivihabitans pingtungensis]
MSASEYNRIRRILFCTIHDPAKGFNCAFEYLDGYKRTLGVHGYTGLKAELNFYQKHGREFGLTVAGDMGEHADFAGSYGSQLARFDVTTNINFKQFQDYEPYMGSGPRYKIALLDQGNFEVIDVLDLAFPRCSCGGYLIPSVILLGQNYNRHGESTWTNDQLLVDVCTGCHEYFERNRFTHHGLLSPQEYFDGFDSQEEYDLAIQATEQHLVDAYKYFRREHSDYLMAVGQHDYIVTEPDGGGYWAINLSFVNQAVAQDMPDEIECSHEI